MKNVVSIKGLHGTRMDIDVLDMVMTLYDPKVTNEKGKSGHPVCVIPMNNEIMTALKQVMCEQVAGRISHNRICDSCVGVEYDWCNGKLIKSDATVEITFSPLTYNRIINVYISNMCKGECPMFTFAFDMGKRHGCSKVLAELNLYEM